MNDYTDAIADAEERVEYLLEQLQEAEDELNNLKEEDFYD